MGCHAPLFHVEQSSRCQRGRNEGGLEKSDEALTAEGGDLRGEPVPVLRPQLGREIVDKENRLHAAPQVQQASLDNQQRRRKNFLLPP